MRRRSPTETIRFLTLDEIARCSAPSTQSIDPSRRGGAPRSARALSLVAYRHGLWASEVGLLRVEDIDLEHFAPFRHSCLPADAPRPG